MSVKPGDDVRYYGFLYVVTEVKEGYVYAYEKDEPENRIRVLPVQLRGADGRSLS